MKLVVTKVVPAKSQFGIVIPVPVHGKNMIIMFVLKPVTLIGFRESMFPLHIRFSRDDLKEYGI